MSDDNKTTDTSDTSDGGTSGSSDSGGASTDNTPVIDFGHHTASYDKSGVEKRLDDYKGSDE